MAVDGKKNIFTPTLFSNKSCRWTNRMYKKLLLYSFKIMGVGGVLIISVIAKNIFIEYTPIFWLLLIVGIVVLFIGLFVMFCGLLWDDKELALKEKELKIKKDDVKQKERKIQLEEEKHSEKKRENETKEERKNKEELKIKIEEIYIPLSDYLCIGYVTDTAKSLKSSIHIPPVLYFKLIEYRKILVDLENNEDDSDLLNRLEQIDNECLSWEYCPNIENSIRKKIEKIHNEIDKRINDFYGHRIQRLPSNTISDKSTTGNE